MLEQVEKIAIESEVQFTHLDRKALEKLSSDVEDSVHDARELREGLSGGWLITSSCKSPFPVVIC